MVELNSVRIPCGWCAMCVFVCVCRNRRKKKTIKKKRCRHVYRFVFVWRRCWFALLWYCIGEMHSRGCRHRCHCRRRRRHYHFQSLPMILIFPTFYDFIFMNSWISFFIGVCVRRAYSVEWNQWQRHRLICCYWWWSTLVPMPLFIAIFCCFFSIFCIQIIIRFSFDSKYSRKINKNQWIMFRFVIGREDWGSGYKGWNREFVAWGGTNLKVQLFFQNFPRSFGAVARLQHPKFTTRTHPMSYVPSGGGQKHTNS